MTRDRTFLGVALSTASAVGSNLRGEITGGGWLYALPRLEHGRIVCVGRPRPATLAALTRAGTVRVHGPDGGGSGDPVAASGSTDGETIDLLVLTGRDALRTARADGILDRLAPDGLVYLEPADPGSPSLADVPGPTLALALTPIVGEPRAIVPRNDPSMQDAVRRLGLEGSVVRRSRLVPWERRLFGLPLLRAAIRRTAAVIGPGQPAGAPVPAYVRDIASAAGHDLDRWRWAVAARGDYDSQKVLILLAPPDAAAPTGVVKVTRSSRHATRLENEGAALEELSALPVATGRSPALWFSGSHAKRAVVGESLVDGTQFTSQATYTADDPLLTDAMGWLADLAEATAHPVATSEVAEALQALLGRYERIYRPDRTEADTLRALFGRIGALPGTMPAVFQHGDPGIWNLLVDPRGRTVFLDWEAAERSGMPLWDILYLFRSYAIAASRRAGVRDRLDGASRHLLDASALSGRLVDAVDEVRRRIDLPNTAIEPLVYGCWLHRALKEATRLPPDGLERGQFVRLIRRMLDRPAAPTLVRLADLGGSTVDRSAAGLG